MLQAAHSYPLPVEIRVFRPNISPQTARSYSEGHRAALGRYAVGKVSSSQDGWWENPFVFALALVNLEDQRLLGGVRIHLHDPTFPMPMMPALQTIFPEGYDYIQRSARTELSAEICGIWKAPGTPSGRFARLLTSKAIFLAREVGVKRLYGFAGGHSVGILEDEGFGYDSVLHPDQAIPYPDERYLSKVCSLDLRRENIDWEPEIKLVRLGII